MSSILLRNYFKYGIYSPLSFWSNITRKVFPVAYVVIGTTLIFSYFYASPSLLLSIINEAIAAILHAENLQLIRNSIDYLASGTSPSPVQQFWALSLQMQFYLLLPVVIIPLAVLSHKLKSSRPLYYGVVSILLISFLISVYMSYADASASYFHPMTRLWEFFWGVGVYLIIVNLSFNRFNSFYCIVGVVLIFGGAFFIPKSFAYPGYIALVPVLGASLIIISGVKSQSGFNSLLSAKWLVYLGGISFSIYLWHWPVLYFYKNIFNLDYISVVHGVIIISSSICLAIFTKYLIEFPVSLLPKNNIYINFLLGTIFFLPVAFGAYLLRLELTSISQSMYSKWHSYAAPHQVLEPLEINNDPSSIPRNEFIGARKVVPVTYRIDCHQSIDGVEARECRFGSLGSEKKVMLVGGSHAAQWLPALKNIAVVNEFELISVTKSSCPLGVIKDANDSCVSWNKNAVKLIEEISPVAVITNSTRTTSATEYIPDGYLNIWKSLFSSNIKVIGIRDNPRFSYDVPDCVYKNKDPVSDGPCVKSRAASLLDKDPSIAYSELIASIDMSDWLCSTTHCPTVNDGMLMYRDANHIHLPYVKYLTASLESKLMPLLNDQTH